MRKPQPRVEFALVDPPTLQAGVFRPLAKSTRREKLDVTMEFGGLEFRWRAPDQLGAQEQSVLLGLLCLAGQNGLGLHSDPETSTGTRMREQLQLTGWATQAQATVLTLRWCSLARASGIGTSGRELAQLRAALARLAETTVWMREGERLASTRLLAYVASDEGGVVVALNCRLTRVFIGKQFIRVELAERHRLTSDTARILHATLSCLCSDGKRRTYLLGKLEAAVFGSQAEGSTGRDRRQRLVTALKDIAELPGWQVDVQYEGRVAVGARVQQRPAPHAVECGAREIADACA